MLLQYYSMNMMGYSLSIFAKSNSFGSIFPLRLELLVNLNVEPVTIDVLPVKPHSAHGSYQIQSRPPLLASKTFFHFAQ